MKARSQWKTQTTQPVTSRIVLEGMFFSFFSLSSYSHLTRPMIGPCFRQSSILHDALRTNQTLVGTNKDPDVMRVQEEQVTFQLFALLCLLWCLLLWFSEFKLLCVGVFSLWNFTVHWLWLCDSTLGLSEFIQVLLRHVVMGPVQHVRLTSYYMQGKVV